MFMIQTKKLVFVNISICDVFLIDARLFDLFIKAFIFNYVTIANVNSYIVVS